MKRPLTNRALAKRISSLAARMHSIGTLMADNYDFNPIGKHGRELVGAARQARTWAAGIKRIKP